MSTKLQRMINRAVREALRRDPAAANEEQVAELIGDGDNADDRSGGRTVQGGFSALAKKVITESDKRRRALEEHVAKHGYER